MKKSNSQYSLITNKLTNYNPFSLEDRVIKLEKELNETRRKCETLQEELEGVKRERSVLGEKNLETVLSECKKYINTLLKNNQIEKKEISSYNQYKTNNYSNKAEDKEIILNTHSQKNNNSFDLTEYNQKAKEETNKGRPPDNMEKSI